ncbi:M20/M25/M40 family metallo-hydrolase [Thalassomonas viridans]|uniref:M20/M25/M40 family metallo-hydrolase n=1 Tax=Thalassomonas viridans TaxID=137584 RepID=A0AAE9Z9G8_9GAMM|nr:M20/M25/M40 family metallo-hydrolase [Thalassomonas viridans]WDE08988.1 M20/M25/M40 family metallo-hydrolase [Thalassomonas viridans]
MDKTDIEANAFNPSYQHFLLELLNINTVSPMETGQSSELWQANRRYQALAQSIGFETVSFAAPDPEALITEDTPQSILQRAQEMGDDFYAQQANLLLQLGTSQAHNKKLVFNFHMDTVAPHLPVVVQNDLIKGRGVADAKGLGVAILAGIEKALKLRPQIRQQLCIQIQSVCGEEGGAMGFYGSRALASGSGYLNIIAEPTNGRYLDQSTSSMTAKITVDGESSTDDAPARGINATVILGAMAAFLAQKLDNPITALGAKMCIAGLHTGMLHNRVYGSGQLMLNFAYRSLEVAMQIEDLLESAFTAAKTVIADDLKNSRFFARSAANLDRVCSLQWTKRRLPVLNNRHQAMESVLQSAGIAREEDSGKAFTCDAMWFQQDNCYSVVFGPGDLGLNGAHTDNEFLPLSALTEYSEQIAGIVLAFHDNNKEDVQ